MCNLSLAFPVAISMDAEVDGHHATQGAQGDAPAADDEPDRGEELNGRGRVSGAGVKVYQDTGDGEDRAGAERPDAWESE
jgi:hypothetical protein